MKNSIFPLILIAGLIGFIIFTGYATSEEIGIWYDRGDGNIVLKNPANNLVIGSNGTTTHKLLVNGSSFTDGSAIIRDTLNNLTIFGDAVGENTHIGMQVGTSITTGQGNLFCGFRAGKNLLTGHSNIFMGKDAGFYTESGSYNVNIGFDSGFENVDGDANVMIGIDAGYSNIHGSDNVMLGSFTGFNNQGINNVFIGKNAGFNELGSNLLYIDNTNTPTPLIYGNFSSNELTFNAISNFDTDKINEPTVIMYGDTGGPKRYCLDVFGGIRVNRDNSVFEDTLYSLSIQNLNTDRSYLQIMSDVTNSEGFFFGQESDLSPNGNPNGVLYSTEGPLMIWAGNDDGTIDTYGCPLVLFRDGLKLGIGDGWNSDPSQNFNITFDGHDNDGIIEWNNNDAQFNVKNDTNFTSTINCEGSFIFPVSVPDPPYIDGMAWWASSNTTLLIYDKNTENWIEK